MPDKGFPSYPVLFNIPIFVALSQNCIANIKNLPCSSLNVELYKGYNSKNKIDRKRILMNISLRISLAYDIHVWKRKNLKEWRRIVDYDVCNKIIIVFFLFN